MRTVFVAGNEVPFSCLKKGQTFTLKPSEYDEYETIKEERHLEATSDAYLHEGNWTVLCSV